MGKIIECKDGTKFERVSRWVDIQTRYGITKKHKLFDYAERDGEEYFIDYVRFKGVDIPLNSIVYLGSMVIPSENAHEFEESGEKHAISMAELFLNIYHSYYVEVDRWGEKMRFYRKVTEGCAVYYD